MTRGIHGGAHRNLGDKDPAQRIRLGRACQVGRMG